MKPFNALKTCIFLTTVLVVAPWVLVFMPDANAITRDGNKVTFTDEEMSRCKAHGGCVITTQSYMDSLEATVKACMRGKET